MRTYPVLIVVLMMGMLGFIPGVMASSVINLGEWIEILPKGNYDEIQEMSVEMNSTYEDWYYKPAGRYIGPTTPESELRFKRITEDDDLVTFTQEMTFSSEDIMSGVGDFWTRTPVKNEGWTRAWVMLFYLTDDTNYFINDMGEIGFDSDDATVLNQIYIDPADESVNDGDDYFSHDGRTYVRMVAPIKPNERYLFVQVCEYDADERIGFYAASTVIPSGRTAFNIYDTSSNENVETRVSSLPLGWSFIMTEGFSDGVKGHMVELTDGMKFEFHVSIDGSELPEIEDYVQILVPFLSTTELDWKVSLYHNNLPGAWYIEWANDTKDYIFVRTTQFTNKDSVSDYWDFMLTIESLSPPSGAEAVFFLFDEATKTPYYFSLPGDDYLDLFLSYYPDNASAPVSSLRIYEASQIQSRKLGFSMVHYVDIVDANGTFLESVTSPQITKGKPGVTVNGLLDYNIIGEGAGAWYDSKVYRGVEGYLKLKDDAGVWLAENIPGIENNPNKAEGELAWMMTQYRENDVFREAVNILISHPFESTEVYLLNGTEGLTWLANEYMNDRDPNFWDIYDNQSDQDGPLDWIEEFADWVKTSWVKFKFWLENLVDTISFWIEMTLAVCNLCCVVVIGLPIIIFMTGMYFIGDFTIKMIISPKNMLHRIFNKTGDLIRSFIVGRDSQ